MKGAIAEISGAKAIMLTDDGEFVTIKNKKYSVGQRVVIAKRNYSRFSAIAACFLLFFMLGGGVWGYYTPVSYVDIDINPSIRLELNILDHVIGVTPLNDDGEIFLENAGELPEDVEECISEITEQATKQGYIHDDNRDVYVYSVSFGKDVTDKLSRCAQNISENDNVNVYSESESEETFKEAKKYNSSMGRIKIIEEYGELAGGSIDENIKTFKGKPNKEIRTAIDEKREPKKTAEENGEQEEFSVPETEIYRQHENKPIYKQEGIYEEADDEMSPVANHEEVTQSEEETESNHPENANTIAPDNRNNDMPEKNQPNPKKDNNQQKIPMHDNIPKRQK